MELTTVDFWKEFWSKLKLPALVDMNFKNDRVIAETILNNVKFDKNREIDVCEIGCAPGKWLIFAYQNFNCNITGFEYCHEAVLKTIENIKMANIPDDKFKIIEGDFFENSKNKSFDLILSLGFIEHFNPVEPVLDTHLNLLKKDGYLVIGVPNFTGINFIFQFIIDFWLKDKWLKSHYFTSMNNKFYKNYLKNKENYTLIFNGFVGGFEPALFGYGVVKNKFVWLLLKIAIKISKILFDRINLGFVSSYHIAIIKRTK